MSTPSNFYAEQVYAEHPIALWTMDDNLDYISLIDESHRDLSTWHVPGYGSVTQYTQSANQPFPNSATTKIVNSTSDSYMNIYDNNTVSIGNSPVSVGFYLYPGDPNASLFTMNISSIDVGVKVGSTITTKNIKPVFYGDWIFISANIYSPTSVTGNASIYIKINYVDNTISTTCLINGVSFGYDAQEYNKTSLGIITNKIANITSLSSYTPTNPNGTTAYNVGYGIKTDSYGFSNTPAYYLVDSSVPSVMAKNNMTPLTYGSINSTMLSSGGAPSMIFPSFGFLNANGKYKTYTFETWLKINNDDWAGITTSQDIEVKIFGPVSGNSTPNKDGLYVVGNSIELKIGNKKQSFFMGYHNRVLLLNIIYTPNYAKVLINGETVIRINLENSDLNLLTTTVDYMTIGSVIDSQIDCVAIYDYELTEVQAKRHYVLGQGVQYPEIINSRYSGRAAVIDYDFAGYKNNLIYPKTNSWETGKFENIVVENDILKFPQYKTPEIVFDNKNSSIWYADNNSVITSTDPGIHLRPTSDWSSTNGYLHFNSMNFTQSQIRGFYISFQHATTSTEQVLFKFINKNDSNYFQISINGNTIYYKFKYNTTEQTITSHSITYATFYYSPPTVKNAIAGIDIDKFSNIYNVDISTFFAIPEEINIYIGGDADFTKTFTQSIESVNFVSRNAIDDKFWGQLGNAFVLSNYVNSNGIFNISTQAHYTDITTYGINPTYRLNWDSTNATFNIACGGFWQTSIPLSYFGTYVNNASGGKDYVLDFIQFNVDSPKSLNIVNSTSQYFDDKLTTVKSFVNFQKLVEGVIKKKSDFTLNGYGGIPYNNVIIPKTKNDGTDYSLNTYQVGDDVIIYTPQTVDYTAPDFSELAMVVYLQFDTKSIFTNPAKVRYLQFAPKSLNTDTTLTNPIATKLGVDIIPYTSTTTSGITTYDYKKNNPFIITKTSNPHLNFNRQSGITLVGFVQNTDTLYDGTGVSRGLAININENQNTTYNIDSIQISINQQAFYQEDAFHVGFWQTTTGNAVKIFELQSKDRLIYFYIVSMYDSDANQIGKIYAVDSVTGNIDENLFYYWNGVKVKNPYVYPNKWGILGINFTQPLSFNGYTGQFRVTSSITFNHFSYYQYSDSKLTQSFIPRIWNYVLYPPISQSQNAYLWSKWSTLYTWNDLLAMSNPSSPAIDLQNLYTMYVGANRYTPEPDGTKLFSINNTNNTFASDIVTQSNILSPT